jgi:hypothetical protein
LSGQFLGETPAAVAHLNEVRHQRSLSMKVTRNLGMLLLGAWLIATGLIPLLNLSFSGLGTLMAVVAIAAGALIIVGR